MATEAKTWRGTTLSERREERRAGLLDAAIAIVGADGAAALTTRSVAKHAGLMERYIYEGYGSRDELLLAVFDAVLDREFAVLNAALTDPDTDDLFERIRQMCHVELRRASEDPGITRILLVEPTTDPVLAQRSTALSQGLHAVLVRSILEPALSATHSPEQIEVIATYLIGGMLTLFVAWSNGTLAVSADELVDLVIQGVRQWLPETPA